MSTSSIQHFLHGGGLIRKGHRQRWHVVFLRETPHCKAAYSLYDVGHRCTHTIGDDLSVAVPAVWMH